MFSMLMCLINEMMFNDAQFNTFHYDLQFNK